MGFLPPFDPFLINTKIGSLPIQLRWYGIFIVGGAMLAAWLASRRAERRGFDPEDIWNQLMIGMVISIACARAYYVAFEWHRFADKPLLYIINPQNGGIAIHGALIGAIISGVIYTRWRKLPFWQWVDICMPTVLVAQAIGRFGNFFNQEAYGRAIEGGFPPFGVIINRPEQRLPPFDDLTKYPLDTTLFHATFLYESVWNILGFGLIMWLERRLRGWRRVGDLGALYAIWYGLGRFWVESFRTDSLCTDGIGGSCDGSFRAAQIASLALVVIGAAGLIYNHMRQTRPAAEVESEYAEQARQAAEQAQAQQPPVAAAATAAPAEDAAPADQSATPQG